MRLELTSCSQAVWLRDALFVRSVLFAALCIFIIFALAPRSASGDGIAAPHEKTRLLKTTKQKIEPPTQLTSRVTGDWVVSDILLTRGLSNSQLSDHRTSSMLLAYRYQLQVNTVSVMNERATCALDTQFASRATPLRALFDGESSARLLAIKRRLLGKINQYALPETILAQSTRGTTSVAIYAYRCIGEQTAINDMGDWFALVGDHLLVPYSQDALLILRRAPSAASAEQVAFCNAAAQSADGVICVDAQRYALHRYIEETATCAVAKQTPTERESVVKQHEIKLKKRNDCGDNASCIWDALFEHAQWIAQTIPALNHCRAGTLQPFAR
jgi:hypothetical protein